MQKVLDKMITGFFVVTLGILWYFSKCLVKPSPYRIVIYDIFGKQVNVDGIRINFKTIRVANSYILEYQKRFSHYSFSIATEMPVIKKNWLFGNLKKIQI